MVAPNSPKERRQNLIPKPANTQKRKGANVIIKKTRQGEAPSVSAAFLNLKSVTFKESGNPHDDGVQTNATLASKGRIR